MPKGRKGGHRTFTDPEELAAQQSEVDRARQYREKALNEGSESESGSESEEEKQSKGPKGVTHLITVENPNVTTNKSKKVADLQSTAKTELSRREREEVERQEAKLRYEKLHAQGKTDEAQADLARLAIVRAEREAAAKRREQERLQKEADKQKAKEATAYKLDVAGRQPGRRGKQKKKDKVKGASASGDAQ